MQTGLERRFYSLFLIWSISSDVWYDDENLVSSGSQFGWLRIILAIQSQITQVFSICMASQKTEIENPNDTWFASISLVHQKSHSLVWVDKFSPENEITPIGQYTAISPVLHKHGHIGGALVSCQAETAYAGNTKNRGHTLVFCQVDYHYPWTYGGITKKRRPSTTPNKLFNHVPFLHYASHVLYFVLEM